MIEANQLYKTYSIVEKELGLKGSIKAFFHPKKKQIHAVQNISLTVQKGEIIGYIGSNGSGKSTTIKMLTGVLYPDQGSVKINGLTPQKHRTAVNKQIGVLFGQNHIYVGIFLCWNLLFCMRKSMTFLIKFLRNAWSN